MFNKKTYAFTLAEVLITIAIVGVVAALTIPNLINNYKAKKLRTQFLKAYSTISQALRAMEADDVPITKSAYYGEQRFHTVFIKYLSGATLCNIRGKAKGVGCATIVSSENPYLTFDGSTGLDTWWLDDGQILLSDGILILFEDSVNLFITVDINGVKNKPNRLGYDVFSWELNNHEKLVPMGATGTYFQGFPCDVGTLGLGCTKKAQSNSDYFKWVVKNVK
jgi:prepilin-type N-terminal cleavage/methylation domain-containing protein